MTFQSSRAANSDVKDNKQQERKQTDGESGFAANWWFDECNRGTWTGPKFPRDNSTKTGLSMILNFVLTRPDKPWPKSIFSLGQCLQPLIAWKLNASQPHEVVSIIKPGKDPIGPARKRPISKRFERIVYSRPPSDYSNTWKWTAYSSRYSVWLQTT